MRTYDIVNAGIHNRFMANGRIVSNSSRIVQLQNLPQNHIDDLDAARQYVLDGDSESIETFFDSLPDTLSQLIRTAFIAKPGYVFAVADFSAIEARVMAWVANEKWMSEAFAAGKDIYCATASQMFGVPVEKKGINAHLRQRGKVSSLALQYAGTINALINMGALKMGIPEEDLPELVEKWRAANQNIQRFWYKMGDAALTAVEEGASVKVQHGIRFYRTKKMMCMELPSGRSIRYYNPSVETNKWGKPQIVYEAYDNGKWLKADTYYGKLSENAVQSIARDCLLEAMMRVSRRYPEIVMHVHDEMIVEVPEDEAQEALSYMCACMAEPIPWAPGLLLKGDGYTTRYYRKD